ATRQPEGTDLCERAASFKIAAERVDGNDAVAVHDAAARAIFRARGGSGPAFIECMTYRWLEHVGPLYDHEVARTYRSRAEVESWIARDPVKRMGGRLVDEKIADEKQL